MEEIKNQNRGEIANIPLEMIHRLVENTRGILEELTFKNRLQSSRRNRF